MGFAKWCFPRKQTQRGVLKDVLSKEEDPRTDVARLCCQRKWLLSPSGPEQRFRVILQCSHWAEGLRLMKGKVRTRGEARSC